jgi:uncharacterized membrane protein
VVVLWIGAVAFVTTVLPPALRVNELPRERFGIFDLAERRFGRQARYSTTLAGTTGFYMVVRLDLWDRSLLPAFWWMQAMVFEWLLFRLMLFVAEPLFLHCWLSRRARKLAGGDVRAHRAAA